MLNTQAKVNRSADHTTFRNQFLTSVVAHNEIHIGPKLERAEQMVTHEILQSDALDEADVSLETHAGNNNHLLMSRGDVKQGISASWGNNSLWQREKSRWKTVSGGLYHLVRFRNPQLPLCGF